MVIRVPPRYSDFYPRPPRGGRLADVVKQRVDFFISIHALREEGDFHLNAVCCCFFPISIHALREEGDRPGQRDGCGEPISIHALREEGDVKVEESTRWADLFLSTPSARRATWM